ncbi:MAG: methyltransferase [Ferruginibacter sp.]
MRKNWKYFWQSLLVNRISYAFFKPFIFIADRIKASRHNYLNRAIENKSGTIASRIFNTEIVLHGPFKGMHYTSYGGTGSSSYYAKLLGSYEKEIHPFILKTFENKYESFINIGCDDGYYAVGMAIHFKNIPVHAYDINKHALEKARLLARKNNVEQVNFHGRFTSQVANEYDGRRSLFIVDCEGDEVHIFTRVNVANLISSDILIELHLHLHPEAVEYFANLFSNTHDISIVDSVPDHLKAMHYNYPELKELDYSTRLFIVEEREVFMQWIFLSAKNTAHA